MPIRCNGVCCNNFVASQGYQSVEHNVRGLKGLVQVELTPRPRNKRCHQVCHCSLKVRIFVLVLDVRHSIECPFHSWGYGAAHYHIRVTCHVTCHATSNTLLETCGGDFTGLRQCYYINFLLFTISRLLVDAILTV